MVAWFLPLILAVVFNVLSYVLMGKVQKQKRKEVQDLESPTADSSRKVPKVYGTKNVSGLNVLHFSDKNKHTYNVDQ
jgi:hypothetical protein